MDAPSPSPRVVAIASTMRAGSTLLKALLAEAKDVSNLPEVNFQRYAGGRRGAALTRLAAEPIVVLKRPAWYHESGRYPRLAESDPNWRAILLVRDAYETILSLRKMSFGRWADSVGSWANAFLRNYWCEVTMRLINANERLGGRGRLVRYEDLVAEPLDQTAALFKFIGSQQAEGVDCYQSPKDYRWKWGQDDGGPKIKSLRVQPAKPHDYPDRKLLHGLASSDRVRQLRRRLGYAPLPAP